MSLHVSYLGIGRQERKVFLHITLWFTYFGCDEAAENTDLSVTLLPWIRFSITEGFFNTEVGEINNIKCTFSIFERPSLHVTYEASTGCAFSIPHTKLMPTSPLMMSEQTTFEALWWKMGQYSLKLSFTLLTECFISM